MDAPTKSIDVKVSGNGFELLGEQVSLNRKAVEVNLEKARQINQQLYGFATKSVREDILNSLDKDLNFEQIITDSIFFKTQMRLKKKLSITPKLDLSYKTSFNLLGKVIVKPAIVTALGPKDQLDSLIDVETDLITRENISDSIVIQYDLNKEKKYENIKFEPSTVEIIVPVDKFTEKVFELGLEVRTKLKGVQVRTFPNKVRAAFLVPLSNYEQFTKGELSAKVELEEEGSEKLKVEVEGIPSYAKLLRVEPNRVEFIIKK